MLFKTLVFPGGCCTHALSHSYLLGYLVEGYGALDRSSVPSSMKDLGIPGDI